MIEVDFLEAAEQEMVSAAAYYESRSEDLGVRFLHRVRDAQQRVAQSPLAWPVIRDGVRRCLVRRFPFGILYRVEGDRCVIIAVMDLRREPGYWLSRIEH